MSEPGEMFSQDIVDFLDQRGNLASQSWLEASPAIRNFVTCPCVIIRPTLFHDAQRISVTEIPSARFVTIQKRGGERSYVIQIPDNAITVEQINMLISAIEEKGGTCQVERSFLVIDLPTGYQLDMSGLSVSKMKILDVEYLDIGIE